MSNLSNEAIRHERLKKIKSTLSIWWVRYVLIPIFLIGPASILTLYCTRQNIKLAIDAYLSPEAIMFLEKNNIFLFLGAMVFLYIFNTVYSFLETLTSKKDTLTIPHTLLLLESFQEIVVSKVNRFSTELQAFQSNTDSVDSGKIFSTITKPDQQIIVIIHTLFCFLDSITRDIQFRVRLAEINSNKPTRWFAHAPESLSPQTAIENLQHPDSTISACLKSKKMEIVESISQEITCRKRRYVEVDERQGSIICYPVYQQATGSYPYVISIYADRDGYFVEEKRELYGLILGQFALRIQLEHNLILLKRLSK